MAGNQNNLLKPTTITATPSDIVAVKDVYEEEGILSKINNFVKKSPTASAAENYLSSVKDSASSALDNIDGIDVSSGDFIPNKDGVKNLLKNTAGLQDRIKSVVSDNYGTLHSLTDNLKTTLIGEVVSAVGVNPQIVGAYNQYQAGAFDDMSVGDYASTIIGAAAQVNGYDASNMLVTIDGIDKLVNCDPFDLQSMQSILTDMTGNSDLFGIVDIGALTGTLSTVLSFANQWNLPHLVKAALDKVDDYKLKLTMLKNAAVSASIQGDLALTKYYVNELQDKCDNIPDVIVNTSKYGVDQIAHLLCKNLIERFHIGDDDTRDYTTIGNEITAYLSFLNRTWIQTSDGVFYFNELGNASKDLLDVMRYTEYRSVACIAPFAKIRSSDNIIRETFPQLLTW